MIQESAVEYEKYFDRLWPILRSITGEGVRQTHSILSEIIPLKTIEIPSGTKVFDWTVPEEWVARDAYLIDPCGKKIIDFKNNNLYLLNYSAPFKGKITLEELNSHLYSLPEMPGAIPYKTSYYAKQWGFCLPENQKKSLKEGIYEVFIDTDFIDGSMTISEAVLPGDTKNEVLLSTYTCHPSLANNELCGPIVTAFLYNRLKQLKKRRLSYRFVFLPETIGSIAYLHMRGRHLKKYLTAGYVITCVGTREPFAYKRSRKGNTQADRAVEYIFNKIGGSSKFILSDFFPHGGGDERQYCSPGFDLPVGSIMRSPYGRYGEYHTSFDNKNIISFEAMKESTDLYCQVCIALEKNMTYKNTIMFCEPQLGKYGLYPSLGASKSNTEYTDAIMWLLNLSDGIHDLFSIAQKSRISMDILYEASQACLEKKLIEEI